MQVDAQPPSLGNQVLEEGAGTFTGLSEPTDRFGAALATGDYDGDGFGDLAVGFPARRSTGWPRLAPSTWSTARDRV